MGPCIPDTVSVPNRIGARGPADSLSSQLKGTWGVPACCKRAGRADDGQGG